MSEFRSGDRDDEPNSRPWNQRSSGIFDSA